MSFSIQIAALQIAVEFDFVQPFRSFGRDRLGQPLRGRRSDEKSQLNQYRASYDYAKW
jgi:hypothetical protein